VRGSIVKRPRPFIFLKEVQAELKKVSWPSKSQLIRLTIIVIGVSLAMAIFIGSLDFIFTKLIEFLLEVT
jgi:preprotein translocase subunit SecE